MTVGGPMTEAQPQPGMMAYSLRRWSAGARNRRLHLPQQVSVRWEYGSHRAPSLTIAYRCGAWTCNGGLTRERPNDLALCGRCFLPEIEGTDLFPVEVSA